LVSELPAHQIEKHFAVYPETVAPAFAGFAGGSFYQVDAITRKPVYKLPDQPVKPVYVEPPNPIIVEEKQFFDSSTFSRGECFQFATEASSYPRSVFRCSPGGQTLIPWSEVDLTG
jgi:hypothetical protein